MVASRLKFIEKEYQAGTKLEVILFQSTRMTFNEYAGTGYTGVEDEKNKTPGEKLIGYLAWVSQREEAIYLTPSHKLAIACGNGSRESKFQMFYVKEGCIYDIKVIIDTLPGSP